MLKEILILIGFTFLPFLELRASIPLGILKFQMDWWVVFLVCVITNMILGPIVYFLVHKFIDLFLKFKWFDKIWGKYVAKVQKKISSYVDRWGIFGVSIFIGIPLPGSGSYSGAIGSYILGVDFKKFVIANIIGVLIAGIIVTLVSVLGNGAFSLFLKTV